MATHPGFQRSSCAHRALDESQRPSLGLATELSRTPAHVASILLACGIEPPLACRIELRSCVASTPVRNAASSSARVSHRSRCSIELGSRNIELGSRGIELGSRGIELGSRGTAAR